MTFPDHLSTCDFQSQGVNPVKSLTNWFSASSASSPFQVESKNSGIGFNKTNAAFKQSSNIFTEDLLLANADLDYDSYYSTVIPDFMLG